MKPNPKENMEFMIAIDNKWRGICTKTGTIAGWKQPVKIAKIQDGTFEIVPLAELLHASPGKRLNLELSRLKRNFSCQTEATEAKKKNARQTEASPVHAHTPSPVVPAALKDAQAALRSEDDTQDEKSSTRELTIHEEDLELFNLYFTQNKSSVDPYKFLNAAEYRNKVLYMWQPLVHIDRANFDKLLAEEARFSFARKLGLCHRSGDENADGVNGEAVAGPSTRQDAAPQGRIRRLLQQRKKKIGPPPQVKLSSATRPYTSREDQTIIAWLSASQARERGVNGNRIWRELHSTFPDLAGTKRSWQSLRARYLRYLLPSLHSLALAPAHASRLRINAEKGELKWRKQKRNSVFESRPVQSASARPHWRNALVETSPETSDQEKESDIQKGKGEASPEVQGKALRPRRRRRLYNPSELLV